MERAPKCLAVALLLLLLAARGALAATATAAAGSLPRGMLQLTEESIEPTMLKLAETHGDSWALVEIYARWYAVSQGRGRSAPGGAGL